MSGGVLHGGDLLILLLDVPLLLDSPPANGAPVAQGRVAAAGQLQTSSLLEQVLYFVAVYLMISDNNLLAVYGLMEHACEALHVSVGGGTPEWPGASSNPTRTLHTCLLDMINRHPQPRTGHASGASRDPAASPSRSLALSAGLSRALCLVHRLQGGTAGTAAEGAAGGASGAAAAGRTRPRILCILSAPDSRQQYIPTMNAIFSAQRADVAIDTLMLGSTNSVYLQQAAHLTGGLYMQVQASAPAHTPTHNGSGPAPATTPRCALQHLLSCMAMDRNCRSMLSVHQPLGVDFRASCFCHKTPVDVGYVCSVCLSIFCAPRAQCMTCGAQFGVPSQKAAT